MSKTSHMCAIYNPRIPEESLAPNSNIYVCVWKRGQEFRNPALVAEKPKTTQKKQNKKIKLWYLRFLMRLCIWCRKETPGIEECLVNALKITCTQFGTPESPGIRIACINASLYFLYYFHTLSKKLCRDGQERLGRHKFNLCVCREQPGTGIGDLTRRPPPPLNNH